MDGRDLFKKKFPLAEQVLDAFNKAQKSPTTNVELLNIDKEQIQKHLDYPTLIKILKEAFQSDITVPQRQHYNFDNPLEEKKSTLLLMPAWEAGRYVGVKIITVSPNNGKFDLPAIQGMYILFDAHKGNPLALMDAPMLTARRTAATSALASSFLSRKNSSSLLMIGTGVLAPELIAAHTTIRPIKSVFIWGRTPKNAEIVKEKFKEADFSIEVIKNINDKIGVVDIISCATLSEIPLISGNQLIPGQHIDLVGSYLPHTREADDEVIQRSNIFIDHVGAMKESGDILIPIQNNILLPTAIKADLFELCKGTKQGRVSESEITCFKSVGHALEDLAAAKLAFEKVRLNT